MKRSIWLAAGLVLLFGSVALAGCAGQADNTVPVLTSGTPAATTGLSTSSTATAAPSSTPNPPPAVPPAGPPPPVPADHAGRTQCRICHAKGLTDANGKVVAPAFPASINHDSFPDTASLCFACHGAPGGTSVPAPATTSATTTSPGGPPAIPASHSGRATCFMCHANGVGPALPASPAHAAFPDALVTCQACHKGP